MSENYREGNSNEARDFDAHLNLDKQILTEMITKARTRKELKDAVSKLEHTLANIEFQRREAQKWTNPEENESIQWAEPEKEAQQWAEPEPQTARAEMPKPKAEQISQGTAVRLWGQYCESGCKDEALRAQIEGSGEFYLDMPRVHGALENSGAFEVEKERKVGYNSWTVLEVKAPILYKRDEKYGTVMIRKGKVVVAR